MNTKMNRSAASWIWDFAGEYRSRYVLSVLSAVCGVICGILPYFVMASIIADLLGGCRDMHIYFKNCLVMAAFWVARCGFHSISTTLSHKATFAVLGNIRKRVCEKLTRVPLGTVLDMPSGTLKNVLVERIDSIETTMAHIIPEFTSNLLVPIVLLVYLFVLDWRMALAVLVTVPIGFGCYALMTRGYAESYQNTVDKTKVLNDTAVEYINGIEVIKAFGKAQSSYEKFVVAAKEGASCYVEWMRRCNIYFCLAMSIFPATMVAVLPIGGLLFRAGTLDADTFIRVILFSVGLVASLVTVMSYGDDLAKLSTIIGEVTGILEQEEQTRPQASAAVPNNNDIVLHDVTFGYHEKEVLHGINMNIREGTVNALVGPSGSGKSIIAKLIGVVIAGASIAFYLSGTMELLNAVVMVIAAFILFGALDSAGSYSALLRNVDLNVSKANSVLNMPTMDIDGRDITPANYNIDVENVEFSYDKRKIIDGVSVHIPQKTTTAIVGPSGGGKTTLCHLIARFWDVDKGSVRLGGVDVKDYSMDSLMRNFSFVFQNVYLFQDTIANNIRFGQPDAPMEKVIEAAKKACCHDFIMALPDGYETVIGEGGASLSGGEKQRLSIARAIMKDAPIIILDETTANVDPESEQELTAAIEALTKEKTILMIAHRLKTVCHADNILVINDGKIVQSGTHEALMAQGGIYRRFVESRELAVGWKV